MTLLLMRLFKAEIWFWANRWKLWLKTFPWCVRTESQANSDGIEDYTVWKAPCHFIKTPARSQRRLCNEQANTGSTLRMVKLLNFCFLSRVWMIVSHLVADPLLLASCSPIESLTIEFNTESAFWAPSCLHVSSRAQLINSKKGLQTHAIRIKIKMELEKNVWPEPSISNVPLNFLDYAHRDRTEFQ